MTTSIKKIAIRGGAGGAGEGHLHVFKGQLGALKGHFWALRGQFSAPFLPKNRIFNAAMRFFTRISENCKPASFRRPTR